MKFLKKIVFKISGPILSKTKKFKNKHLGESCYIFGDGSTIKHFDLSLFSDKISFSLGYLPFHKNFSFLNCKYCLLVEPYFFYPFFRLPSAFSKKMWRNNIQKRYKKFMYSSPKFNFFVNLSNYLTLWKSNIYFLFKELPESDSPFFKECVLNNENIFKGSLRFAISIAIYMGFKEIYLVGCDYTHQKNMSKHWYEKGEGLHIQQPDGYLKKFFKIANKYIKITTVTLDGKGQFLESITYKELKKKDPLYRENFHLIEKENLHLLAEWPGYEIF